MLRAHHESSGIYGSDRSHTVEIDEQDKNRTHKSSTMFESVLRPTSPAEACRGSSAGLHLARIFEHGPGESTTLFSGAVELAIDPFARTHLCPSNSFPGPCTRRKCPNDLRRPAVKAAPPRSEDEYAPGDETSITLRLTVRRRRTRRLLDVLSQAIFEPRGASSRRIRRPFGVRLPSTSASTLSPSETSSPG